MIVSNKQGKSASRNELIIATCNEGNLRSAVMQFNASQNDVTVKIEDYQFGTTREAARTRLMMELASGSGPDLIDLEAFYGVRDSLAAQGYLSNLLPDLSSVYDVNDYYFLEMSEGHLYYTPSCFQILSAITVADRIAQGCWTYETLADLIHSGWRDRLAENREYFVSTSSIDLISSCINYDTNTCNFTLDNLGKMLNTALLIPETTHEFPAAEEILVGDGDLLYSSCWIGNPLDIVKYEKNAQCPLEFIGFPSSEGSGRSYFYLSHVVGINANSPMQHAAMEFIKFILSDEYQSAFTWGDMLPVKKSVLQSYIHYLENPYAEYEGKEITINEDGTFDVDGVHMDASYDPTPGITKEQITKFYELIEQCRTAYDYDSDLNAIIRNTSERFFAGQITVEQAVEDVSVRANLYLEEQKRH